MRILTLILLPAAVVLVAALPGLGDRDLWPPDEARYATVSRELAEGAPWPVPHLNGEVYPDKPPGFFWLVRGFSELRGGVVDEASARLPSLVGGVILAVLVALLLARAAGTGVALLGSLLVVGGLLFSWQLRYAQLDLLFAGLIGASLAIFYRGSAPRASPWWCTLAWLFLFLAVFVKGPLALVVLLVVWIWGWIQPPAPAGDPENSPSWLRRIFPVGLFNRGSLVGLVLLALLVGAWLYWAYASLEAREAGTGFRYLERAIGLNVLERAQSGLAHEKPWYAYLVRAPITLLPFFPLIFLLLSRGIRQAILPGAMRLLRFATLWFMVFFVVQSIFPGKREIYLLTVHAAFAILLALTCDGAARAAPAPLRVWSALVALLVALVAALCVAAGYSESLLDTLIRDLDDRAPGELVPLLDQAGIAWTGAAGFPLRFDLILVGAVALAPAIAALALSLTRASRATLAAASLAFILLLGWGLGFLAPHADLFASRRPVGEMLARHVAAAPERPFGMFRHLDEGAAWYFGSPLPEIARDHRIGKRSTGSRDRPAETTEHFAARVAATRAAIAAFLAQPDALLLMRDRDREKLEESGIDTTVLFRDLDHCAVRSRVFLVVEAVP